MKKNGCDGLCRAFAAPQLEAVAGSAGVTLTRSSPLSQSLVHQRELRACRVCSYSLQNIRPIPCLSLFPQQAAALHSPHALNVNSDKDSCSLPGNGILPLQSWSIWVGTRLLFPTPPIIYTKIFVGCSVAKKSLFFQKRTRERKKPIRSFS